MPGINETLFQLHHPTITEEEAIAAFRAGVAVSVSGYAVSPGFVLRFATEDGSLQPIVMTPYVLNQLRVILGQPNTDASSPPTSGNG